MFLYNYTDIECSNSLSEKHEFQSNKYVLQTEYSETELFYFEDQKQMKTSSVIVILTIILWSEFVQTMSDNKLAPK